MIRFRRLTPVPLNSWLVDQGIPHTHQRYRLRVWREVHGAIGPLRDELIAYVQEALDDVRRRIRSRFQDDLSPFNDPVHDPAAHYPAMLNRISLQGHLECVQNPRPCHLNWTNALKLLLCKAGLSQERLIWGYDGIRTIGP